MNAKARINIDMPIKDMFFVDMQSGLINKGAIFGDKGYCTKDSTTQMKIKNLHNCTIIALSKPTIWKIKTSIKINGSQKQDHRMSGCLVRLATEVDIAELPKISSRFLWKV